MDKKNIMEDNEKWLFLFDCREIHSHTGCSDTTAQTVQNENLRYEYIKVVRRTIPQQCVVFEKNAKK